jgi:hypothetical protein
LTAVTLAGERLLDELGRQIVHDERGAYALGPPWLAPWVAILISVGIP